MLANKIVKRQQTFSLTPKNLEEAMQYAKLIADSDFCPKEHRGKAGNILVAVQYGAELGLSPMQALQNIAIINGRPCVWGDALLGLVMAHPSFINIHEEIKETVATCTVWRKGREPVTRTFSRDDAKRANLLGKPGPWSNYESRMLQSRARSFALRDSFADVLRGLNMREEVEDYEVSKDIKKFSKPIDIEKIEVKIIEDDETKTLDLKADIEKINTSQTLEDLQETYKNIYKYWIAKKDKEILQKIMEAKDNKKDELIKQDSVIKEFNDEIDAATDEVMGEQQ